MKFCVLGSGSRGNATYLESGETRILIDAGMSGIELQKRLASIGVDLSSIDAILVTHEHSDHCSGVAALSRKHQIPVYLTHGTANTGRCAGSFTLSCFNCEDRFEVGQLQIKAVAVPHDAAEPCQYLLSWQHRTLGILTDLGSITPHVVENYRACDSLVLEFNHDLPMLQAGSYPPPLKRRVGGDWGHLNNLQAAELLRQIDGARLENLVVAHISENNNGREHAERALLAVLGDLDQVVWAQQDSGFDWLEVART